MSRRFGGGWWRRGGGERSRPTGRVYPGAMGSLRDRSIVCAGCRSSGGWRTGGWVHGQSRKATRQGRRRASPTLTAPSSPSALLRRWLQSARVRARRPDHRHRGQPDSPINRGTLCPKGCGHHGLLVHTPAASRRSSIARRTAIAGRTPARMGDGPDRPAGLTRAATRRATDDDGARSTVRSASPPRRRDARQRRELPDQEALHRRAGHGLGREPGPYLTLLDGARSGHHVRPRRRHDHPVGPRATPTAS